MAKYRNISVDPGGNITLLNGALNLSSSDAETGAICVHLGDGTSYAVRSLGEMTFPDPELMSLGWASNVLVGVGPRRGRHARSWNSPMFFCRAAPLRIGEIWQFWPMGDLPGHNLARELVPAARDFRLCRRMAVKSLSFMW